MPETEPIVTSPSLDDLKQRLDSPGFSETQLPDGTSVMLDISGHRVMSISETGTELIRSLRHGAKDVDDLATALTERFDVDVQTARADAAAFIRRLAAVLGMHEEG